MTIQIEDILSIACSSVQLSHSNDFQKVFLLSTASEAKLVFDVLVAYGFDVKVYHQEDDTSKLYITHPTMSASQLEEMLSAAKAYTVTLKQIKQSLDKLCADNPQELAMSGYNMTFANLHPKGKQIVIQISSNTANMLQSETKSPLPQPTPAVSSVVPPQATTVSAQSNVRSPKAKYSAKKDEFSSGPAVGRGKYPKAAAPNGEDQEETLKKRILLYMFGNMATSSFAMVVMASILAVIFTIFVFAKGLICPDFASMKRNTAWYCHTAEDDEREAKQQQKAKQLERIGIQAQ